MLRVEACLLVAFVFGLAPPISGQVHYHPTGRPWAQRASAGPDAEVPGWYYNLGTTGIRVELVEKHPKALLVRYVFPDTPADKNVEAGDLLVGVNKAPFEEAHQNGYGMDVFGARGPISELASAISSSQNRGRGNRTGKLSLLVKRRGELMNIVLNMKRHQNKTLEKLLDYLVDHQREDGSWGSPPHDTFAPLALMSSSEKEHKLAVLKNVRMHAEKTRATDDSWLINWRYMAAGIVLCEYYLHTGEKWLLPEIQEVYDFLISSQYVDLSQLNPKSHDTHPHAVPKTPLDSHGGWGHNPGFEGYGPISMLTAQGALTFALMQRCGIEVDKKRHEAAYDFLRRASGENFYVWYEDQAAGANDWADMGRTGAAAIAFHLSPLGQEHRSYGKSYAGIIGKHPESFPDTHGSPIMGMGFGALGAFCNPVSFEKLMNANQWWFTLAECPDGSFYYQPNRDNAGYGADSRISASAAVAFILSLPTNSLALTGKKSRHGSK